MLLGCDEGDLFMDFDGLGACWLTDNEICASDVDEGFI